MNIHPEKLSFYSCFIPILSFSLSVFYSHLHFVSHSNSICYFIAMNAFTISTNGLPLRLFFVLFCFWFSSHFIQNTITLSVNLFVFSIVTYKIIYENLRKCRIKNKIRATKAFTAQSVNISVFDVYKTKMNDLILCAKSQLLWSTHLHYTLDDVCLYFTSHLICV